MKFILCLWLDINDMLVIFPPDFSDPCVRIETLPSPWQIFDLLSKLNHADTAAYGHSITLRRLDKFGSRPRIKFVNSEYIKAAVPDHRCQFYTQSGSNACFITRRKRTNLFQQSFCKSHETQLWVTYEHVITNSFGVFGSIRFRIKGHGDALS